LVDDQIQRMIEGRYRGDNPDGLLGSESPSPLACRGEPHRDFPAGKVSQFLGGVAQPVDRSEHFGGCVRQWLAALLRDEPGEMGLPRCQQVGGFPQYGAALMGFEPRVTLSHHPRGGREFSVESFGIVCWNLRDYNAIICLNDLKLL
jgi:hypothetical protein